MARPLGLRRPRERDRRPLGDAGAALVGPGAGVGARRLPVRNDVPAVGLQDRHRLGRVVRIRGLDRVGRRVRRLRDRRDRAVGEPGGAVVDPGDDRRLVHEHRHHLAEVQLGDDLVEVVDGVLEVPDHAGPAEVGQPEHAVALGLQAGDVGELGEVERPDVEAAGPHRVEHRRDPRVGDALEAADVRLRRAAVLGFAFIVHEAVTGLKLVSTNGPSAIFHSGLLPNVPTWPPALPR